ncbi:MAG: glucose sorbosone dehydrogenase [Planctomycetota bacterium]|nr:MAG: glucose sorbosone dehydrogenase [Planctomycetota bacterium]
MNLQRITAGFLGLGLLVGSASGLFAADQPTAAALPQLQVKVGYPNLKFKRPVAYAWPNDQSGRSFVVEQDGRILAFANKPDTKETTVFLDIHEKVNREGNEEGLLGMAFHPKFKDNGQIFVYYSAMKPGPRRSVVSRFTVSKSNPNQADPASEQILWVSKNDPFGNHNGGCIDFGQDGQLYISLGDSGAADDPLQSGQDGSDWWGSILRIDVDHPSDGKAYGIPSDNPVVRDPVKFKGWAPEVYCIGLRNVWKFSFDRSNGRCWAGDVGQNLWEEVDIIVNGGNYGWSVREGKHAFPRRQKLTSSLPKIEPIAEYNHSEGKSITGGYVYRGKQHPSLDGLYIYGDFDSGRVWAVRERELSGEAAAVSEVLDLKKNPRIQIAAFGEDEAGEIYILGFDGKIYSIMPAGK